MFAPTRTPATLAGVFLSLCVVGQAAPPLEGIAERMTREAIDAGIAGEDELRAATLAKVLELAPDYAPARWEAGQIKVDGEWVSIPQLQSQSQADPIQKEYTTRRDQATDQIASQYELAKWCDEHQLSDEASYHWWQVLQAAPDNAEALQRLELAWFQGQLVQRSELEELRTQQQQAAKALKDWNARITTWTRKMAGGEAQRQQVLAELRDQVDESAIPAFEQFAGGASGKNSDQGQRKVALSKAFLEAMADRETFAGTQTLVRHALLATSDEVRQAAAAHLPNRPQAEVVPLLLDCLAAPIESRFDIRITPSGRTVYVHELEVAGREADEVVEISREGVIIQGYHPMDKHVGRDRVNRAIWDGVKARTRYAHGFHSHAVAVERQVAMVNTHRKEVNARATALLEDLTGNDLGHDPRDWWNDWQQSSGYEASPYRPTHVYREYDFDYDYVRPPCSCFLAGTPVWTKTGQQAIESLGPGDLVLCQDITTGELLFRPVLETTLRDPSPMIEIAAGGEVITATQGHPFWVPGKGWRMAKELATGDRLLTVNGPMEIESVTAAPNREAYNLIVAEHANYFVGTKGMLVHDNTPRSPAEASEAAR